MYIQDVGSLTLLKDHSYLISVRSICGKCSVTTDRFAALYTEFVNPIMDSRVQYALSIKSVKRVLSQQVSCSCTERNRAQK